MAGAACPGGEPRDHRADERCPDLAHGGADRPPYRTALALGAWAWENRSLIKGRITLAGGNPDGLTLSPFLDAGYALLVEAYRDAGGQLMGALEKTAEYAEGAREPEVQQEMNEDLQNQASLAQLQNMMKGIGR
jgi:hypothetical protein